MSQGLYISPTEFVSFSQQTEPLTRAGGGLSGEIATRLAAGDITSLFGLLPNPDPILKQMGKQIEVYRNLLVDPSVNGPRGRRTGAVQSMERGFDAELSKRTPARVLKACEDLIANYDVDNVVEDLIDGAFFGYRVGELMWDVRGGLPTPSRMITKPPEWFGFDPQETTLKFRPRSSTVGVAVPERKFVVVGKRRSWENPYGESDLASCFWPITFKRGGLKFWVTFTEKYGMPWAVGKLPRNSSTKDHDDLADKLARMVRDAVATIPDDASVELLTVATSANADMYKELLMYCRSDIAIALLGNNQSMEMQSNKASAAAAQHVEGFVRDSDARMIASGINQIVRFYCEVNFPGAQPPVYAFWEQESVDDVQASRDEKLSKSGANLTRKYYMKAYKLSEEDLGPDKVPQTNGQAIGDRGNLLGVDSTSFADATSTVVPPDQAALDAAIDQLPADAIQAAMKTLLTPALKAIEEASTPDEVRQALVDAWPDMDASALEDIMTKAYFVADLVGRDSVKDAQQ